MWWSNLDEIKKKMSATANGRPTQFHAVPLEERAVDSQGKTLPWALEWHEDHPNFRHQKRHFDEKGAFGKLIGRRGSSRGSRTATPARKENPIVEGFEQALNFDRNKAAEEVHKLRSDAGSRAQNEGHPSRIKEPTQAILYGYHPATQWAAIFFYEKVSEGMICEDYERDPPYERWKYQNHISAGSIVRPRALTKEESILARQYRGGNCWIKVTFDSAEAADRAFSNSPHLVQRHWVYAEPYYGAGPSTDEPIPMREQDREQGLIDPPKPSGPAASQTLGPSFSRQNSISSKGPSTLPRNFTNPNIPPQTPPAAGLDAASQASSTTISSATATAPEQSALRNRFPPSSSSSSSAINGRARNPNFFTHFPDVPKTTLRPAHEAFLPHPSWTESIINHISAAGLLPSGMIGEGIPRLENGEFDWAKASMYWKAFYWIDSNFGTDFCGLKDE